MYTVTLIKDVGKCTCDNNSMVLTTPKDAEEAGKKKLEDAAWYQQDYGVKMSNGGKKYSKKEELLAPKNLYQLGDDHTYTTLNEHPGTYAGSPGAATIDLGKNKPRPSQIDFDDDSDDESILSSSKSIRDGLGLFFPRYIVAAPGKPAYVPGRSLSIA